MFAILRRDLAAYFNSVTVWVVCAAYLFIAGLIFMLMLSRFVESSMMAGMGGRAPNLMEDVIFGYQWWLGFLMIFVMPMLTMRLLAEEKRTGTLELLFTYPVSEWEIVLAKFGAALLAAASMLGVSTVALVFLNRWVALDWRLVGSGYGGLLLLAAALVAIGLWASSLSSSQVVAACVTYGMGMSLWLIYMMDSFLPTATEKLGSLGIMNHLESFARGNLSSHDCIYYLSLSLLFLFLTVRVLDSRKWVM